MKKCFIFFIPFVVVFFACSKARCPVPASVPDSLSTSGTTGIQTNAYTITLQPGSEGKDAVIDSYSPTTNFGNTAFLAIEAWTQNGGFTRIQRSLLDFDYSPLPSGAIITSAVLTLYADTTSNYSAGSVPPGHSQLSGSNAWNLSRITSAWDEQTVTWNTMPGIDTTTTLSLPASDTASEPYSIDVTTFVKDQIAKPTSYYGFYMNLVTEIPYRAVYFYSSNGKYPTLHPTMVIGYIK